MQIRAAASIHLGAPRPRAWLEQTTVHVAAHFSDRETEVLREGTEWDWDPGQSPLVPLAKSRIWWDWGLGWDPLPKNTWHVQGTGQRLWGQKVKNPASPSPPPPPAVMTLMVLVFWGPGAPTTRGQQCCYHLAAGSGQLRSLSPAPRAWHSGIKTSTLGDTSLVVQWLGLCAPKASIPGQGTRFHMPQLRLGQARLKNNKQKPTLCRSNF